jgi:ABC-type glycerol-3-phosphate transport system substrate-binding protein
MKRKVLKFITTFSLLMAIGSVMTACDTEPPFVLGDDGMAKLEYPDFAETPDDKNSWEYISNEDVTIKWYVDVSSWVTPLGTDAVSKKIKEVTGITVKFETPVADDGQKLSTMIDKTIEKW